MVSTWVQQSPHLVELMWLEYDSRLARRAGFMVHQIHKRQLNVVAELSEVNRRDYDRYWNTIENTIALPDRSFESGKPFHFDASRVVIQSI